MDILLIVINLIIYDFVYSIKIIIMKIPYMFRICEIQQFIGTDKNRNNFYGVRCSHVINSIHENYNLEVYPNIGSN